MQHGEGQAKADQLGRIERRRRGRPARAGVTAIGPGDVAYSRLPVHRRRVEHALMTIEDAVKHGRIGVGYSGGKDSTVLLDLVRRVVPDAIVGFFDSGCELTWTYDLAARYGVQTIHPVESLPDACRRAGYWGYPNPPEPEAYGTIDFEELLIHEPARRFVAENRLDVVALGLRAQESRGRWFNSRRRGDLYEVTREGGVWRCLPLNRWTHDDVWAYIAAHDLDYNPAYDRMTELGIPRDKQRVSTLLGVSGAATLGRYTTLRQIDPALWNRLAADFPRIGGYT